MTADLTACGSSCLGLSEQRDYFCRYSPPFTFCEYQKSYLARYGLLSLDTSFPAGSCLSTVLPSDSFTCASGANVGSCRLPRSLSTQWIRLLMLLTAGLWGWDKDTPVCCVVPEHGEVGVAWPRKVLFAYFWLPLVKAGK